MTKTIKSEKIKKGDREEQSINSSSMYGLEVSLHLRINETGCFSS